MLFPYLKDQQQRGISGSCLLIFIVALVIGVFLIGRVPPLLHTPLMSMTNAISGITIVVAGGGPVLHSQMQKASWAFWR